MLPLPIIEELLDLIDQRLSVGVLILRLFKKVIVLALQGG
jgi:hypothetical protein